MSEENQGINVNALNALNGRYGFTTLINSLSNVLTATGIKIIVLLLLTLPVDKLYLLSLQLFNNRPAAPVLWRFQRCDDLGIASDTLITRQKVVGSPAFNQLITAKKLILATINYGSCGSDAVFATPTINKIIYNSKVLGLLSSFRINFMRMR